MALMSGRVPGHMAAQSSSTRFGPGGPFLSPSDHNTDPKSMRASQLSRLEGCAEVGSLMFSGNDAPANRAGPPEACRAGPLTFGRVPDVLGPGAPPLVRAPFRSPSCCVLLCTYAGGCVRCALCILEAVEGVRLVLMGRTLRSICEGMLYVLAG